MQSYTDNWDCDQKISLQSVSPTENITFLDFFQDFCNVYFTQHLKERSNEYPHKMHKILVHNKHYVNDSRRKFWGLDRGFPGKIFDIIRVSGFSFFL